MLLHSLASSWGGFVWLEQFSKKNQHFLLICHSPTELQHPGIGEVIRHPCLHVGRPDYRHDIYMLHYAGLFWLSNKQQFFFFFFSVLFESLRNNTETLLGALATMTVPAGNRVHFVRFCLIKQTGFLCIKYVLVFIPGKKPWQLLGLYSDMTSTPLSSHSSDTGSISFSSLGIGTNLK